MRVGVSSAEHRRRRRCSTGCSPHPPMAGRRPRRRGHHSRAVRRARRPARSGSPSPRSTSASSAMTPRRMAERGIEVHVLPSTSTVDEVLATGADGVFLSNGPGDPATADRAVALTARRCSAAGCRCSASASATRCSAGRWASAPTSCATATAASTSRCRTARPARSRSPRTTTASRSTPRSTGTFDTPFGGAEVSHVCLNDDVVEGLRCHDVPAFSVQYHPEAAAGPHDAAYLFDRFAELLRRGSV